MAKGCVYRRVWIRGTGRSARTSDGDSHDSGGLSVRGRGVASRMLLRGWRNRGRQRSRARARGDALEGRAAHTFERVQDRTTRRKGERMSLADRARVAIASALESMARAGELGADALEGAAWVIERPKRPEHGDLATNVALAIAKRAGKPPRVLADALVRALASDDVVASAQVAGPGFVNLRLHPRA